MLIGNAGILGPLSPLGHIEPKDWDNLFAVNVTANWQLIRCMDPLLRRAPAGRAVFLTSAVAYKGRAYWGPYAASKAALDALVRAYAAESATTPVRVNLFAPGPTRTRMYLGAFPGIDPDDAADAGRRGEGDRAAVPARMRGERKNLRLPRREVFRVHGRPRKISWHAGGTIISRHGWISACAVRAPCRRHDPKRPSSPRNFRYAGKWWWPAWRSRAR